MNAAEICIRAPRADVEAVLARSTQIDELIFDGDVTRVAFVSEAVANVVDDEQAGYLVSVFVFDPMEQDAARSLYDELVQVTGWPIELRDENTYDTISKRP